MDEGECAALEHGEMALLADRCHAARQGRYIVLPETCDATYARITLLGSFPFKKSTPFQGGQSAFHACLPFVRNALHQR